MARLTISLPDSYEAALKERAALTGSSVSGLVARLMERGGLVPDPVPPGDARTQRSTPPRVAVSADEPGSAAWKRARASTERGRAEIAAWTAKEDQ